MQPFSHPIKPIHHFVASFETAAADLSARGARGGLCAANWSRLSQVGGESAGGKLPPRRFDPYRSEDACCTPKVTRVLSRAGTEGIEECVAWNCASSPGWHWLAPNRDGGRVRVVTARNA